ncbi:MAG: DUF3617 family protein [Pseudomonadota bacterium]
MTRGAVFALGLVLGGSLLAAPVNMKPGKWETTIEVEMPGMPMKMPPIKAVSCATEKDLVPSTAQKDQDCKVLKQKITNSTVEWTVSCKDPKGGVATGEGKVTYSGDSYQGQMVMTIGGGAQGTMKMLYKMQGKHLGACDK